MKRAMVKIAGDVLAGVAAVLVDHGLKIVGSTNSPAYDDVRTVVLIVEDPFGNLLPDECADKEWHLVRPEVSVEAYGEQRLRKITRIIYDRKVVFGPSIAA